MRVFRGNKRDVPEGMDKFEWAIKVFAAMDEEGIDQAEAKLLVAERHRNDADNDED